MEKALIPVTDQKEIEKIFLSDGLTQQIEAIKKDALGFVADLKTGVGRKAYASKGREIASQKVVIDNAGKDLKSQYKVKCDQIDAVRKSARDTLDEVKANTLKPLTEWKAAQELIEQEKRDLVELTMDWEAALAEDDMFNRQKEIERREAEWEAREAERLEKERAEQEEKERVEREARIAREATERAEREAKEAVERAEKEKQDAIEAAEREKVAVELKAKEDAERADLEKQEAIEKAKREEIERQERERLQKEEEDRLKREVEEKNAANVAHQRKINKTALEGFTALGIKSELGKKIITAIAHKEIKHITINY